MNPTFCGGEKINIWHSFRTRQSRGLLHKIFCLEDNPQTWQISSTDFADGRESTAPALHMLKAIWDLSARQEEGVAIAQMLNSVQSVEECSEDEFGLLQLTSSGHIRSLAQAVETETQSDVKVKTPTTTQLPTTTRCCKRPPQPPHTEVITHKSNRNHPHQIVASLRNQVLKDHQCSPSEPRRIHNAG